MIFLIVCIHILAFKSKTNILNILKVKYIPWVDEELNPETSMIQEKLAAVNKRGVMTINSQPNVNGAPSTDPRVGWGSPGGYIYQKVMESLKID